MEMNAIKNNITAAQTAQQAQQAQRAQEARQPVSEKPVEQAAKPELYQEPDSYSPREPEEPSGMYWVEPGEDGPAVNYDGPEKPAAEPAPAGKQEGRPVNQTTMNTDEVDREIERLKKKAEDLEKRLGQAQGPERDRLEKQLKQTQGELDRKDNDAYRRQHAKIS